MSIQLEQPAHCEEEERGTDREPWRAGGVAFSSSSDDANKVTPAATSAMGATRPHGTRERIDATVDAVSRGAGEVEPRGEPEDDAEGDQPDAEGVGAVSLER